MSNKIIPILFSTAMVQAILDGRKTQTRRVVKSGFDHNSMPFASLLYNEKPSVQLQAFFRDPNIGLMGTRCPYGKPGDVLWVRETWTNDLVADGEGEGLISYKADFPQIQNGWKPNIHMPKAACRLWLKLKAVRVERLQDISEDDAKAEGIARAMQPLFQEMRYMDYLTNELHGWRNPSSSFQSLWQSINGPESWEANPWVWVIEFERCEMPADFLTRKTAGR